MTFSYGVAAFRNQSADTRPTSISSCNGKKLTETLGASVSTIPYRITNNISRYLAALGLLSLHNAFFFHSLSLMESLSRHCCGTRSCRTVPIPAYRRHQWKGRVGCSRGTRWCDHKEWGPQLPKSTHFLFQINLSVWSWRFSCRPAESSASLSVHLKGVTGRALGEGGNKHMFVGRLWVGLCVYLCVCCTGL